MAANTILTDVKITRKALEILHSKLSFIGTINRQYDSEFGREGAKIGDTLKVRLPNQYTVRTGRVASIQGTNEQSTSITIATMKGVDVDFTSTELTLSMDDFSERVLEPAMAVLASTLEADAFNMYKDVYQLAGSWNTSPADMGPFLDAKTLLNRSLTPGGDKRFAQVNSKTSGSLVYGMKGFFQDSNALSKQYLEGFVSRLSGFDFYENELVPTHTNGAATGLAGVTVSAAPVDGVSTLVITGLSNLDILNIGSVFTIAGVYMVHPETKTPYDSLQQFVITAKLTSGGSTDTITVSPAFILAGPTQNVDSLPVAGHALTFVGTTATAHAQNLMYHKDAFAFVTADLPLPKGMEMAWKEQYDGLSLRLVRGYDILNDLFISRIDILYGYKTIRPQLACRITS